MIDITQKIQAASHSGATLQVFQSDGNYFVRKKINAAIEKNHSAIQKQSYFKPIKTPSYNIIAIPVTDIIHSPNELSITMPYIEGLGGEQVAYKGSKVVARSLKTALDFYLIKSVTASEDQCYPVKNVIDKIEQISTNLTGKWHIFPDLKSHIMDFKQYCRNDLVMPMGECHGDLTLSNLKVTEENELVLFDFLTCEINSPLQDAAKLIQDFEYGWSFRKEKTSVRIKGEIFCEHAMPSFLKTLNRLFYYEMRIIETLTILRIAPYIQEQDNVTIDWFNNVMIKTMRKIKG
ncbi:phosphotransferase [Vibrio parahaemolyticus]|uniref:phosphotransferase n=1 Tax=Vibrio parahaemolyticus TaxID=670 RepID=UPI001E2EE969|nr:phosphotransferase [Vibrio parahaemolyticus]MDF4283534.1 phosphotransferase [Vibrio parahaemolyticus]MDF4964980.1 phosphotransferase [Vibrio parahaemolyticus]MDF5027714.1 phosphotransferase [Vibrio parahaemolyticus]MDF5061874.1 phosphotransferase [Vibrio parahaemolyticus]MDF5086784.1 phosphotransferase [Vibrio parahaemolyticus]